jgi:hypothetical protein
MNFFKFICISIKSFHVELKHPEIYTRIFFLFLYIHRESTAQNWKQHLAEDMGHSWAIMHKHASWQNHPEGGHVGKFASGPRYAGDPD